MKSVSQSSRDTVDGRKLLILMPLPPRFYGGADVRQLLIEGFCFSLLGVEGFRDLE